MVMRDRQDRGGIELLEHAAVEMLEWNGVHILLELLHPVPDVLVHRLPAGSRPLGIGGVAVGPDKT